MRETNPGVNYSSFVSLLLRDCKISGDKKQSKKRVVLYEAANQDFIRTRNHLTFLLADV